MDMSIKTPTTLNQVLIALGSNLGDKKAYITQAIELIDQRVGPVTHKAPHYSTEPIGAADQTFINTAVIAQTALTPQETIRTLLQIEQDLGRTRDIHWGNRTIDCDIILWRNSHGACLSINSENLIIPHPRAHERDFVMTPAVSIAPDWYFTDGETVKQKAKGH
jgi:2-amino-4-hydroxy-6-hydroxymethyldihydropteridine diphosphokinase